MAYSVNVDLGEILHKAVEIAKKQEIYSLPRTGTFEEYLVSSSARLNVDLKSLLSAQALKEITECAPATREDLNKLKSYSISENYRELMSSVILNYYGTGTGFSIDDLKGINLQIIKAQDTIKTNFQELVNDRTLSQRIRNFNKSRKYANINVETFSELSVPEQLEVLKMAADEQRFPVSKLNLFIISLCLACQFAPEEIKSADGRNIVVEIKKLLWSLAYTVIEMEISNYLVWQRTLTRGDMSEAEALSKLVEALARKHKCRPVMVAQPSEQLELLRIRPTTIDELVKIKGFSVNGVKVEKWGKDICDFFSIERAENTGQDSAINTDPLGR